MEEIIALCRDHKKLLQIFLWEEEKSQGGAHDLENWDGRLKRNE